jgi:hypothetical protein
MPGYEHAMSRGSVALGAFVVVGVGLWLAIAWRAPSDERDVASAVVDLPEPEAAAQQPSAALVPEPAPLPTPAPPVAEDEDLDEEQEPEPNKPSRRAPEEQIKGDQGPVAEYRKLYESESRQSNAAELEAKVSAAFQESKPPPDMIRSILCRQTICKIEMRWSMDRLRPYIGGLTRAQANFAIPVALSPVGPKDAEGMRLVEVYLKRKPPGAATNVHAH